VDGSRKAGRRPGTDVRSPNDHTPAHGGLCFDRRDLSWTFAVGVLTEIAGARGGTPSCLPHPSPGTRDLTACSRTVGVIGGGCTEKRNSLSGPLWWEEGVRVGNGGDRRSRILPPHLEGSSCPFHELHATAADCIGGRPVGLRSACRVLSWSCRWMSRLCDLCREACSFKEGLLPSVVMKTDRVGPSPGRTGRAVPPEGTSLFGRLSGSTVANGGPARSSCIRTRSCLEVVRSSWLSFSLWVCSGAPPRWKRRRLR
jgi:hypothetical protein